MDLRAVGQRLKSAREAKGWTQEVLAEKVDLSADHIGVVERGVKSPRLETFIDIANALECDANSLLEDVLAVSNQLTSSRLSEKLSSLPPAKQRTVLRVVETLMQELDENHA